MRFTLFTLFPSFFDSVLSTSIIGKAFDSGKLVVDLVGIRAYGLGKHLQCDDVPYGGGAGMVMMAEPVVAALDANPPAGTRSLRIYLSPRGRVFNQSVAKEYAGEYDHIQIICGRYEGLDQRVIDNWVDEEVSIGDYVLAGGEVAAAVILEAVGRLVPGVLGSHESLGEESFADGLLEYPQYTRPRVFRGFEVPEVLCSGDHGRIAAWRHAQSEKITQVRRPDLLVEKPEND